MKDSSNKHGNIPETIIESVAFNKFNTTAEPYLLIVCGVDKNKRFKLINQYTVFGRGPGADILLSDLKISRRHACIDVGPDGIIIEDLDSTNGTFIDGARIDKKRYELSSRIQVGNLEMKVEYKKPEEVRQEESIYLAANTDSLTKLLNRRAFLVRASEELSFSKRNNSYLSLILCDIDYFKLTNDNFGHLAGDKVLASLAEIMSMEMREEDMLARFGGEEFIMILRETDAASTLLWCERVCKKVAMHHFESQGENIPITISIGICTRKGSEIEALDSIIKIADDALYQAKNTGRNRVVAL